MPPTMKQLLSLTYPGHLLVITYSCVLCAFLGEVPSYFQKFWEFHLL